LSKARVKPRMTPSGARLIVVTVGACCVGLLIALPRPIEPTELPALRLDAAAVTEVRAARRAASAPESPQAALLRNLYLEQGRAEVNRDTESALEVRRTRVDNAVAAFLEAHDEEALAALRNAMVAELPAALGGDLEPEEEEGTLGSFPRILERYHAAVDGVVVAPDFVVETLYAARWNTIFHREPTDGFTDVEKQAYWGWLALRSRADMELRKSALEHFAEAGGSGAAEAAAVLAFHSGSPAQAAILFDRLYEGTGELRFRNHALAAQLVIE